MQTLLLPGRDAGIVHGTVEREVEFHVPLEGVEHRADAADPAERKRIAEAVQRRANEVVPYVPLGQLYLARGYSTKLSGILAAPLPVYWNIAKAN